MPYIKASGTGTGYVISLTPVDSSNPADSKTYYFGMTGQYSETDGANKVYIPKAGTIKVATFYTYATGAAGTNEAISVYIRKNSTTDTLIATVSAATAERLFKNTALSIAVAKDDFIEFKFTTPAWVTNPGAVFFSGLIYIE